MGQGDLGRGDAVADFKDGGVEKAGRIGQQEVQGPAASLLSRWRIDGQSGVFEILKEEYFADDVIELPAGFKSDEADGADFLEGLGVGLQIVKGVLQVGMCAEPQERALRMVDGDGLPDVLMVEPIQGESGGQVCESEQIGRASCRERE